MASVAVISTEKIDFPKGARYVLTLECGHTLVMPRPGQTRVNGCRMCQSLRTAATPTERVDVPADLARRMRAYARKHDRDLAEEYELALKWWLVDEDQPVLP